MRLWRQPTSLLAAPGTCLLVPAQRGSSTACRCPAGAAAEAEAATEVRVSQAAPLQDWEDGGRAGQVPHASALSFTKQLVAVTHTPGPRCKRSSRDDMCMSRQCSCGKTAAQHLFVTCSTCSTCSCLDEARPRPLLRRCLSKTAGVPPRGQTSGRRRLRCRCHRGPAAAPRGWHRARRGTRSKLSGSPGTPASTTWAMPASAGATPATRTLYGLDRGRRAPALHGRVGWCWCTRRWQCPSLVSALAAIAWGAVVLDCKHSNDPYEAPVV